jgi:hypothetical protein
LTQRSGAIRRLANFAAPAVSILAAAAIPPGGLALDRFAGQAARNARTKAPRLRSFAGPWDERT